MSTIPGMFTSRLFKTILMIFVMFFDVTGSFGRPEHSASPVSVQSRLILANRRQKIAYD